jgi:hypothetical protein
MVVCFMFPNLLVAFVDESAALPMDKTLIAAKKMTTKNGRILFLITVLRSFPMFMDQSLYIAQGFQAIFSAIIELE